MHTSPLSGDLGVKDYARVRKIKEGMMKAMSCKLFSTAGKKQLLF